MKINSISNGYHQTLLVNKAHKAQNEVVVDKANKGYELPSYNMIAANLPLKSLSFKGDFEAKTISKMNDAYIKQIQNAETELRVLRNPVNNPSLTKAKEENAFYDDFEKNRDRYYNLAKKSAYYAKNQWKQEHGWWYRQFHSRELDEIMSDKFSSYYQKRNRYYDIGNRYSLNKTIIDSAAQNEENRLKRIKDLNELIDKNKKLIDYSNLQNSINEMLAGKGGIDERLAGYKFVKDKIRKFIENIKTSKDNENAYVQPCVLLYGATGTGKSTFLKAIESMKLDNVAIVRFDENQNIPFMERFRAAVTAAKQRYFNNQQRTILLMDDAEKYFAMSEGEAKAYYQNELDEADWIKLKTINDSYTNKYVKDFKSILDELSMIPTDDDIDKDSFRSAMSIFITTNHPNIIDRQLIKRPEKMDAYHVGPAKGQDLNEVVKFYFKDKVDIINKIKMFKDRPDRNDAINGLSGLSIDAKESIKRLFKEGKADMLLIDPDSVDYDVLTEDIQPNEKDGAFSNVMIKSIAKNAFEKYLEDPENDFAQCFYEELTNAQRDIEPQRYQRYIETANYVNLFKESGKKDLNDEYEFVKMLQARNNNFLKVDTRKYLESYINDMRVRQENLEDKLTKGIISENECVELESLRDQMSYVNDPQKVKDYLKTHKSKK